jgi:hypothetical protein
VEESGLDRKQKQKQGVCARNRKREGGNQKRCALHCAALLCDGMQCAAICVQVWLTVRV